MRSLPGIEFDGSGRPRDASLAPRGLACWAISPEDLVALQTMHEIVKAQIATPIPWAGGSDEQDSRWRGYGLLPKGRRRLRNAVKFHSFETEGAATASTLGFGRRPSSSPFFKRRE